MFAHAVDEAGRGDAFRPAQRPTAPAGFVSLSRGDVHSQGPLWCATLDPEPVFTVKGTCVRIADPTSATHQHKHTGGRVPFICLLTSAPPPHQRRATYSLFLHIDANFGEAFYCPAHIHWQFARFEPLGMQRRAGRNAAICDGRARTRLSRALSRRGLLSDRERERERGPPPAAGFA